MFPRAPTSRAESLVSRPLLSDGQLRQLFVSSMSLQHSPPEKSADARPGELPSQLHGSGGNFDDLREYYPGDNPRFIDWRATARSSRAYTRRYLAEFSQPVILLIDRRASMRFGSSVRLKVTQAVRMAAVIAGTFLRHGYEVGMLLLDDDERWFVPSSTAGEVFNFLHQSARPCPPQSSGGAAWSRVFSCLQQRCPQGGKVFILSDFAGLTADELPAMRVLGHQLDLSALRIIDSMELHPQKLYGLELGWGGRQLSLSNNGDAAALQLQLKKRADFLVTCFKLAQAAYQQLPAQQDDLTKIALGRS